MPSQGHLQAADEVGQRVLEAERDGDTADAKSGYERIGVDAKTCIQDDADACRPDHAAGDIDDDAGGGQGIALLVEVALEDARCHASGNGGYECKGECPQRALHKRDFEDGKWTFHGNSSGAYNGFDFGLTQLSVPNHGRFMTGGRGVPSRARIRLDTPRPPGCHVGCVKPRSTMCAHRVPRARPYVA